MEVRSASCQHLHLLSCSVVKGKQVSSDHVSTFISLFIHLNLSNTASFIYCSNVWKTVIFNSLSSLVTMSCVTAVSLFNEEQCSQIWMIATLRGEGETKPQSTITLFLRGKKVGNGTLPFWGGEGSKTCKVTWVRPSLSHRPISFHSHIRDIL